MPIYFVAQEKLLSLHAAIEEKKTSIQNPSIQDLKAESLNNPLRYETRIEEDGSKTGIIPIQGVLMNERNKWWDYFEVQYTVYTDIIKQVQAINAEEDIESIKLLIDSPGGMCDGYHEAATALRESTKPIYAHIQGQACSAAYGLASEAESIEAKPWSIVGCLGVMVQYGDWQQGLEKHGYKVYTFRSSQGPYKNPDIGTEEFSEQTQKRLDGLGEMFFNQIASGRGQDVEYVLENYGKGRVFLGTEALNLKMIDSINIERYKAVYAEEDNGMSNAKKEDVKEDVEEKAISTTQAAQQKPAAQDKQKSIPMEYVTLIAQYPEQAQNIADKASTHTVAEIELEILKENQKKQEEDKAATADSKAAADLRAGAESEPQAAISQPNTKGNGEIEQINQTTDKAIQAMLGAT